MKQTSFKFKPSLHVPFRDTGAIARVRAVKRADIEKHSNPDYRIKVYPDAVVPFIWVSLVFKYLREALEAGREFVLITPNPNPMYAQLAYLINQYKVDCRKLYTFNMDEYADENGRTAPESWPFGFMYAFKKYFYANLNSKLRPLEKQCFGPMDKNIKFYGKMIADHGGADLCLSGPGWTGHLAFIDPDSPEYDGNKYTLAQWKKLGPKIVTLSPFTIAQNSLHGSFGMSGDLSAVPPRAATIGPNEAVSAKHRIQTFSISVHNTRTAWQRMIARLAMHGPVTPLVPESICQTLRTDVLVSETIAEDIKPDWNKGY
ncbi:MAG: hypothetical protein WC955_09155 [Elusimicrobiota bacterium]